MPKYCTCRISRTGEPRIFSFTIQDAPSHGRKYKSQFYYLDGDDGGCGDGEARGSGQKESPFASSSALPHTKPTAPNSAQVSLLQSRTYCKEREDASQRKEMLFKVLVGKQESQKYKGKKNNYQISWSLFPPVSFKTGTVNVPIHVFAFS